MTRIVTYNLVQIRVAASQPPVPRTTAVSSHGHLSVKGYNDDEDDHDDDDDDEAEDGDEDEDDGDDIYTG